VRQWQYEAKERTIIGTTLFAQKDERTLACLIATRPDVKLEVAVQCEALIMRRIAEPFEGASA
jgi:hypothetical protein